MNRVVIIDSIDKRMTIPLVAFLKKEGFEVHGIHLKGTKVLCSGINEIYTVAKERATVELERIYSKYSSDTALILGNPTIIDATNILEPQLKYILPAQESIAQAEDKKSLMVLAQELGLMTPQETQTEFPMVIKLNNSENSGLSAQKRYYIVRNEAQYKVAVAALGDKSTLLFQHYITGNAYGVSMLLDESSNLVDYIVHERELEYPIQGGPSALCKTVEKRVLVEQAYRLLKALNWKGLAMVEFKGEYLLEINPRFWGTMPLIFKAHSTFFNQYLKLIDHQNSVIKPEQVNYKMGARMYYFPQAYVAVLKTFKTKNFKKAFSSLGKILLAREGIFSFRRPVPFFRYLLTLVRRDIK